MGVVPGYRGRSIGRKLLGAVEKYAELHGYIRMYLRTTPEAIHLYERGGFKVMDKPSCDFHGVPVYTMEKLICWKRYANLIHKLQ
jgi:N-acetylglutamate synthase-like GNAT family acetyltransferase